MNNENLTLHFKVKDFNTGVQVICAREGSHVSRNHEWTRVPQPHDPDDVVILQDVVDVSKARIWLGSNEMKGVMEKSGVLGSPSVRYAAAA